MQLKRIIKNNYKKYYDKEYIFEKVNDKYKAITYGIFIENSLGIANYLIENGYKNKKIMIISENSTKLMELDLAVTFYVGVSAIVSKEWKEKDLLLGIKELNPDCLIYSENYKDIIKNINIKTIPINKIKTAFNKELLDLPIKSKEKLAKIVFSSGTTGKSKAVKLSLKNMFAGYDNLLRRCPITSDDSAYLFLPLNHTYGEIYNFMYSLIGGFQIYLASSTKNIGKELLETNPTIFCGVPLIYNNLLESYQDNIDKAFGKNIKWLFCGGAPISKETRKIYKDKGLCLMQAYALSETASSLTIAYPWTDDLESVGEIFEDIDVKIANKDKDGIGEIIVKGDNVFLGYTDPELTKKVFDKNGYFYTGDLGYIKNNKIYLKGRKKKMLLTSNGENVDMASIENNIKNKSKNIEDVKAFIKNDKIAVNIYVTENDDYERIINDYNDEVPKYEKVSSFEIYKDSLDVRLKQ